MITKTMLVGLSAAAILNPEFDLGLLPQHKVEMSKNVAFAFPLAGSMTTPPIFPTGSSQPATAYSGTFIPQIWSGKLVEKFYAATVLAAISNTDYEGEIKSYGDTVNIRTIPTITVSAYLAGGNLTVQRPSAPIVTLLINQGYYFNAILDDVMRIQSDINLMSLWSDDAAQQMKIAVDTQVLLGILHAAAATTNRGVAAGVISQNINLGVTGTSLVVVANAPGAGQVTVIDVITRLGQTIDEQNIPEIGRWVVIPTWFGTQIKLSELREVFLSGDQVTMLRNGKLGMIDRFTVYVSNLLPNGTAGTLAAGEYVIYAGHAHALTFASQMTNVETLRSEFTFGNLMRGLQVFGYQVVDPKALAEAIVTQGS
jgi:hypothetical protein